MGAEPFNALAVLRGIEKSYRGGDGALVQVLRGVDLTVCWGEFVALMGPSGSGKSTLMNILTCLDQPDAGSYVLNGREIARLDDQRLSEVRGRRIGIVFQAFNLIPELDTVANVELPLAYQGLSPAVRRRRAIAQLERVGLGHRLSHRAGRLSGGEMQRVAIARALVVEPVLLVADEPTGNLDSVSGAAVMEILHSLHHQGVTIVLVTHDPAVAAQASRTVHLHDGTVVVQARPARMAVPPADDDLVVIDPDDAADLGFEPTAAPLEPL